jgi:hypothetical protein
MALDGVRGDEQACGDLRVVQTLGDQAQDLGLTFGEPAGQWSGEWLGGGRVAGWLA